jgi:hypothetical protein
VIERPRRRSWRAGYVIVPIAAMVAFFQIFVLSDHDRMERPGDRQTAAAPEAPSPTVGRAAKAPQAERSEPEAGGQSAEREAPPQQSALAGDTDGADEATMSLGPAPIRISIYHTPGTGNALPAIQLAAYLQARGFAVTDIRPVEVKIDRRSVRYFVARDRPETRRLAAAIGAFFAKIPGQGPDHAVEPSHFSAEPDQGRVEIWLPPPGAGAGRSA